PARRDRSRLLGDHPHPAGADQESARPGADDHRPRPDQRGALTRSGGVIALLIAALGCGAAGALTLANMLSIAPGSAFDVTLTAYMIFCVIIGGLGTIEGPIIGAVIFFVIQDRYSGSGAWYLVALGALAIVMAIRFRQGIWGLITARTRLGSSPSATS